jgi:hypothetical protein
MAHHQPDPGRGDHAAALAGQIEPLAGPEPEPVHRCIDMQRRRPELCAGLAKGGPFQQFLMRTEHGRQPVFRIDAGCVG